MRELKRLENESNKEFGIRLYSNKIEYGLSNKEIYDTYVKETGDNRAESSIRGFFTNLIDGINIGYEKALSDREEDSLLEELEVKRIELEKEKIRMQDQRREYKNLIRPEARFERILEVLGDKLDEIKVQKPFIEHKDIYNSEINREAVLVASDWHIGSSFDNYFGKYNLEIAKQRLNELLNKTIEYCKMNKVNTLHLELLGDNISGGIHWSSKVDSDEDCMTQALILCDILEEFVGRLADKIPNVKVYSVVGNHSRINMNKKDNQKGENLERLVPWSLRKTLKDVSNVEIMDGCNIDDGIVSFKVINTNIIGVHGDLDKPNQIINDMIKMFKFVANEYHMGHLHHHFEKEEHDIEILINGSLQGTDEYAKNIRKTGRPMQKLMIYDNDGKLCTYKIKL